MISTESKIINLISAFLEKEEKKYKEAKLKCGHAKGDPNHIEAGRADGDAGSAFAIGTQPSTTEVARPNFDYDAAVSEVRSRSWGMGDED